MTQEEIRKILVSMYPNASKIEVFINSQEMQIVPTFTKPIGFSMKDVSGNWIK
jgi:hypothetical protein